MVRLIPALSVDARLLLRCPSSCCHETNAFHEVGEQHNINRSHERQFLTALTWLYSLRITSIKTVTSWAAHCADAMNEECVTPLHCAALAGSPRCARLLVDAGADTSALDTTGRWVLTRHIICHLTTHIRCQHVTGKGTKGVTLTPWLQFCVGSPAAPRHDCNYDSLLLSGSEISEIIVDERGRTLRSGKAVTDFCRTPAAFISGHIPAAKALRAVLPSTGATQTPQTPQTAKPAVMPRAEAAQLPHEAFLVSHVQCPACLRTP